MNKRNMNTDLMYNFKWTKLLAIHCTYKNCTILGPTRRHRQVELYNVCTILACSSRTEECQTYNICTFEVFSSRAKESKMYIYCTFEVFWLTSFAYNFSSIAFSKVQRTITDFCVVQSAKRVYKTFAGNCTQSTTEENQHFRIVQQIQLFAQV